VPAVVVCTGLACGALLTTGGLILWDSSRQVTGLPRAVCVIRWLTGALLLIGALLAWQEDRGFSAPASRLILMASLAALPQIHRRRHFSRSSVALILPALTLVGAALLWSLEPAKAEAGRLTATPVELTAILGGGLGARALGEALSKITTPTPQVSEAQQPSTAAYALLTLLVSGLVLINLWQRGSVWGGTVAEGGLAGGWLAWSAAWVYPRRQPRSQAALIAVAALSLISIALK